MLKKFALLAALTVAAAPVLSAQAALRFDNGGSINDGHYYVGPYQGNLGTQTGSTFQPGTEITINCVDFFHEVNNGDVWKVNSTSLAGDLSNTRLGNSGRTQYEQAAFLTTQYAGASNSDVVNIQHAIWTIMGATDYSSGANLAAITPWLTLANASYQNVDYSGFTILTQVGAAGDVTPNDGTKQEFVTTTPEPSSMALLGTGLIGMVPLFHRRRRNG